MPKLGYGVFQIDDDTTERTVAQALDAGYRMIDTAQAYFNERGVGAGIKDSGVAREDIFLVTKVWVTNYGRAYDSLQESLERLGTDHVDLVLLHQAYNDYYGAWRDQRMARAGHGCGVRRALKPHAKGALPIAGSAPLSVWTRPRG